jgi:ABC-type multidrug transport system permease subunit
VTTRTLPRLGAACGILFPVGLFVSAGRYSLWAAALLSIALFLPFLAYLCSLLRHAEGEQSWLVQAAFAAGLAGITLKLGSIAPEVAIRRLHIADGSSLHTGLQGIADAGTDVCLYPLGLMLAAIALAAVHTGVLPRWLSYGAGLTAVALVVNGSYNLYNNSGSIPAFLLFLLWTLVAGVVLFRRTRREPAQVERAQPAAAV